MFGRKKARDGEDDGPVPVFDKYDEDPSKMRPYEPLPIKSTANNALPDIGRSGLIAQLLAGSISACCFATAVAPLGTLKRGRTVELRWFTAERIEDLLPLDYARPMLVVAGLMLIFTQALHFALMCWCHAPTMWLRQDFSSLEDKGMQGYTPHHNPIHAGSIYAMLSLWVATIFVVTLWILLSRSMLGSEPGVIFSPFWPSIGCLLAACAISPIYLWRIRSWPAWDWYEDDIDVKELAERDRDYETLTVCFIGVGAAICALSLAGSMPFITWSKSQTGSGQLYFITLQRNWPKEFSQEFQLSATIPTTVLHFAATGTTCMSFGAIMWTHVKKQVQGTRSICMCLLAATLCGSDSYAWSTIYWRAHSYMPNGGIVYGPAFWLSISASASMGITAPFLWAVGRRQRAAKEKERIAKLEGAQNPA